MELALNRAETVSKEVVKELGIALAIGIGYFTLCIINPFQMVNAIASISTLSNIRLADVLRAKAISSIGAAVGIATGAHFYNVYQGKVGIYSVMPIIILGIWITANQISHKIGKTFWKDLAVIGVAGLVTGVVVTLHLTTLASLLGANWSKLLTIGAMWKMINHALVPMIGYVLFKQLRK